MLTQRQAVASAPGPLEGYAVHFDQLFNRANRHNPLSEMM